MYTVIMGTLSIGFALVMVSPFVSPVEEVPAGYWLAGLAFFACLVWLTTTLFGFWRVGRLSSALRSAEHKSELAEHMMRGDVRRPIWVWSDGRCHGDPSIEALLNLSSPIMHLDELHEVLKRGSLVQNGKPAYISELAAITDPVSGAAMHSMFTPDSGASASDDIDGSWLQSGADHCGRADDGA